MTIVSNDVQSYKTFKMFLQKVPNMKSPNSA